MITLTFGICTFKQFKPIYKNNITTHTMTHILTPLNLLLKIKNINTNILTYLKYANQEMAEINEFINTYDYEYSPEIEILIKKYTQLIQAQNIKEATPLQIEIDAHIYSVCQHEFIEDYIDITPDTSKKIKYCVYCELNENDYCNKLGKKFN